MTTLASWYPGDTTGLAILEVLVVQAVFVGLALVTDCLLASRPVCRASLWQMALVGVLLAPLVTLGGRFLPWRVGFYDPRGTPRPPLEISSDSELAFPQERPEQVRVTPSGSSSEVRGIPVATTNPAPGSPSRQAPSSSSFPDPAPQLSPEQAEPAQADCIVTNPLHALVTLAFLVWVAGSLYLAARLAHGTWRLRRLGRSLAPLDEGRTGPQLETVCRCFSFDRHPEVSLSPEVRSPLVVGLFRPRVILPVELPWHCSDEQMLAILVHECAHIARKDPWMRLLQRLVVVLYWVHPLVHLLQRRLDRAREQVCDNHVLAVTDPPAYAETLLTVAQVCYPSPRFAGYLTMFPRLYPLERRVADLLEEQRDTATRLSRLQWITLLALSLLLLVALASVGFPGARAADTPQETSSGQVGEGKAQGRILATDGSPAGGAIVWAAQYPKGPLQRFETTADAMGRWSLPLGPGEWWVWARRGTQGGEMSPHGTFEITAGKIPTAPTIRLEERGTFRGRMLEAETGKPIVGGKLVLDTGLLLTSGAGGKFTMGGVSRTHHEAFVVAPGRRRMRVLFDTTGQADTELDIPVPRAGKIVGRVTDTEGKPIPGAYVGRSTSGSIFSINGLYAACDSEGRFEYDDAVPVGQPTRLKAAAPGYVEEERSGRIPSMDKPLVLEFRLRGKPGTPAGDRTPSTEKRRAVTGVVVGPDGKPVAGVVVRWGYQAYTGRIETRTDVQGRFRLEVPDKANKLAVLPRAFLPAFSDIAAGGDQEVKVALKPGRVATGKVVDDRGKPIGDVRVVAVTASPDPRLANPYWLTESEVFTDANGWFEMKGVPPGARFDFLKRGLSDMRDVTLDLARSDTTVTMLHDGALFGRVVDHLGKPIRDFRVLVAFPQERRPGDQTTGFFAGYSGIGVRFTSPEGRFVLTGVGAKCVYRVRVVAEGHGEAVVDRMVSLPANHVANSTPVTLQAGKPVRFRFRAVTDGGKPIPRAQVTLIHGQAQLDTRFHWGYDDASWEDMVRGNTDSDGWATFPALSAGTGTVVVRAPGFGRHRIGWRDRQAELTGVLAKEAILSGEIRGPGGKPLDTFHVYLSNGKDLITASVGPTDRGRFRIRELAAGSWHVRIADEDGLRTLHEEQVKLEADKTKEMQVQTRKK